MQIGPEVISFNRGEHGMKGRAEERNTNSDELRDDGLDDGLGEQPEEIEAREPGRENAEPSVDEVRLQAYYRYLQREDGDDEIANWLEAESELRDRAREGGADRRGGEQS
jgi:hypothetical protein